ncbi:MAG: hypothetical protein PUF12_09995 [Thermoflexaceae bacterium]|nr:hypothetical protein [Thermoflexaceae bacterium]
MSHSMKENTGFNEELVNNLEEAGSRAQYDEHVKRIIGNRSVLARILKETVREFEEYDCDTIMKWIEPEIQLSSVAVRPGLGNRRITGTDTEDKVPGEGVLYYDVRFRVYIPEKNDKARLKLLINIEAQKKFYQKYHIVTRGIFYGARMISAQLGTEFENSDYNKIKKVYSIWICLNAPKKVGNTMTEYSMRKRNIIGKSRDGRKTYDKLSVIIICLNDNQSTKEGSLHDFLNVLLSEKIKPQEKINLLIKRFGMKMEKEFRNEVAQMCNLSEAIEEKAIKRGIRKGFGQGNMAKTREVVRNMIQYGMKDEDICCLVGCSREMVQRIRNQ